MGQTMVEKIADALKAAEQSSGDWRVMARAALEAMREPTEAMCMVDGPGDNHTYQDAEYRQIFQRMIDAALAEG